MYASPLAAAIDTDPPIPFTDEEIGSAAHEKHMPSVRAIAVDLDRGLVLLNLIGADASVSAVIMELLRSKSNGVGFMLSLFAKGSSIPTQLTIQQGIRYTTFRSALATPGGSISLKNWCLLIATANLAESRRRADHSGAAAPAFAGDRRNSVRRAGWPATCRTTPALPHRRGDCHHAQSIRPAGPSPRNRRRRGRWMGRGDMRSGD
jgi:hypothetical protein